MKHRMNLAFWVMLLFLSMTANAAELVVWPSGDGKAAAIATTDEPIAGRWLVFRAAPFSLVADFQQGSLDDGRSLVWFEASGGAYVVVLVPNDTSIQFLAKTVNLGEVKPDPDPDPDPDPPPGKRTIVIVAEADNQTAYREKTIEMIREYALGKEHVYELHDPDLPGAKDYLAAIADADKSVPAVVVLADTPSGEVANVLPLPSSGTSISTAKQAGESVIRQIKEWGG